MGEDPAVAPHQHGCVKIADFGLARIFQVGAGAGAGAGAGDGGLGRHGIEGFQARRHGVGVSRHNGMALGFVLGLGYSSG